MDVHKPKGVRTWKALAGEVGIIVLGVLIALAAEQTVQGLEWAQKVHGAVAAMRSELGDDDGPEILQRAVMHPCVLAKLDEVRAAVESGAPRETVTRLADGYQLEFLTFDSLAHNNAMVSGVAAHMNPEELDRYATIYAVIPMLDRVNDREAQHVAKLRSLRRIGGPLSDAERDRMIEAVETLRQDEAAMWSGVRWTLPRIQALHVRAPPEITKRVLGWARATYGACIHDLPPDWMRQP